MEQNFYAFSAAKYEEVSGADRADCKYAKFIIVV
jgi:hypothetical protein